MFKYKTVTLTVTKTEQPSTSFEPGGAMRGSYQLPAAIDGNQATVQFCNDDMNWTAAETAQSVAANGTYQIPAKAFDARYIRINMASAQTSQALSITVVLWRDE